jgi:hypothetical protein
VTLTGANDAPQGTNNSITASGAVMQQVALAISNFGFQDEDSNDSLKAVRIDSLPEGGTLSLNGQSVLAGALINANDISAGRLVFSSSSTGDSTNLATLTFTVQDQLNDFSLTSNILSINRAPQVSNFTSSALREQTDNSTLTTTIPISFTDIDTADIGHTVTVSGVTASGIVSGLSGFSNAQLISWLSPEAVTKPVDSNAGSANLSR